VEFKQREEYISTIKKKLKEELKIELQQKRRARKGYHYESSDELRCYRCGKERHIARKCFENDNKSFKKYTSCKKLMIEKNKVVL
jgi:hypothetical protein